MTPAFVMQTKYSGDKLSRRRSAEVIPRKLIESVYRQLRDMIITFQFPPGTHLNEGVLAQQLGVSRTPVREALNRLTHDGFLTHLHNQGFFRKALNVSEISDIFEFRQQLEMVGVRLAIERASYDQLQDLVTFAEGLMQSESRRSLEEMIAVDETFHTQVITLVGNGQLLGSLQRVSDHIRYIRGMDIYQRQAETLGEFVGIAQSMCARDEERAAQRMSDHLGRRLEQITDIVERCYGRIYMNARRHAESLRVPM